MADFFANVLIWHPGFKFVDGAHWFLSALIAAQFVIGLGIVCRKAKSLWVDFVMILSMALFLLSQYSDIKIVDTICSLLYCKDVLMFLIGVYLWQMLCQHSRKGLVVFLLLSMYFVFYYRSLLVVACLILFVFLIRHGELSNKVPRVSIYVGEVSFCWYLIHQNIGYIIIGKFDNSTLGIGMAMVVTFVAAVALNAVTKRIPRRIV